MTNLHMQFELYTYIQTKVRERKLKFISRGITLSKNHPTMTKFELDLHNPMMYSYTKFKLNVCNRSRDNERKPFMEWQNDGMMKGNTICPRHEIKIKMLLVALLKVQCKLYGENKFGREVGVGAFRSPLKPARSRFEVSMESDSHCNIFLDIWHDLWFELLLNSNVNSWVLGRLLHYWCGFYLRLLI
jgi:hypothetical protein